jgi:hypothetical protein
MYTSLKSFRKNRNLVMLLLAAHQNNPYPVIRLPATKRENTTKIVILLS